MIIVKEWKELVNMQTKFNPSERMQRCPHDFCLNDCAECDEMPRSRISKPSFNPSRRNQIKKSFRGAIVHAGLPWLEADPLVITRNEWKEGALYVEATRTYHMNKIRRKRKNMKRTKDLNTGETVSILEGRMVS